MDLAEQRRHQFVAWMRANGLNARQVSIAAGVPYTTINSYENGSTRSLTGENEARIAVAYDEPVESVFGLAKPFPNHLRAWRERSNLSAQDAAKAIGSSAAAVELLESGDYNVSNKWLRALAPVYGTRAGLLYLNPDDVSDELLQGMGLSPEDQSMVKRVIESLRTGTSG